jgi:hypothetical protein
MLQESYKKFHYATKPLRWKNERELNKRNEAFVALTQAKIWCVVRGIESLIFDRLRTAQNQYPVFTFPAFNQATIERINNEEKEENWWSVKNYFVG